MIRPSSRAALAVLLSAASAAPSARGDSPNAPTDEQKASARILGTEGVRLAMAGDCRNALDKLSRAEALVHAPTTAVPLAQCEIQLGKVVAGTEILNRLLNEALPANAPESWVEAKKQVQPLLDAATPKIGRLRVHVDRPASFTGAVQVTVDGEPLPSVILDNDRATDPGVHHVAASAQGLAPAAADVSLAEGQSQTVALKLEPLAGAPLSASVAPASFGGAPEGGGAGAAPVAPDATPSPSSNRVPAYVVLGVGGAGILVGSIFGILALGDKSSLDGDCPSGKNACPQDKQSDVDSLNSSLKTHALVSTLGLALGAVGLGVGTYLFFSTRPESNSKAASLELRPWLGPRSAGLVGSF
jgi:hypothetical protein